MITGTRLSSASLRRSIKPEISARKSTLGSLQRVERKLKDERPLTSRAFQEKAVEKLEEFLILKGYTQAIKTRESLRQLQPRAVFWNILSFLILQIDPDFRLPENRKMEDETPEFLKDIG